MRIGITYDLKIDGPVKNGLPDDFQEEYDSPATVEAVASALRELGHQVEKLGDGRQLLERLLADPPDLVFNFAEGQGIGRSREARVPAVLEMLGIPYTGSDPLTLAVTLDKDCAKRLVQSAGVAVPRGVVIDGAVADFEAARKAELAFPVIIKPAWEGSSKGIRDKSVVDRPADLPEAVRQLRRDHRQPVLVEEFIDGDELTVGVVGNDPPQIIGIMRVLPNRPTVGQVSNLPPPVGQVSNLPPQRFIYSLEVKRDFERQVRYDCPAQLAPADTARVREKALAAYHILGCRDVARIDFRLRDGVPYFLEVNPLPGLNPHSGDLCILSRHCGWSYPQLIRTILQGAIDRCVKNDANFWSVVSSQ